MIWWWYKMWVVSADLLVWWIFDLTAPPTLSLHGNIKRVPTLNWLMQLFFLLLETISDHLFNDVHWLLLTVSCFCPQVNQNTFSILTDTALGFIFKVEGSQYKHIQYSVFSISICATLNNTSVVLKAIAGISLTNKSTCLQYNILNAKMFLILPSNIFFSHFWAMLMMFQFLFWMTI